MRKILTICYSVFVFVSLLLVFVLCEQPNSSEQSNNLYNNVSIDTFAKNLATKLNNEQNEQTLFCDNKFNNADLINVTGEQYLNIKSFCDVMNSSYLQKSDEEYVLEYNGNQLQFVINQTTAQFNGKDVVMQKAPIILNGELLLHIDSLAKIFEFEKIIAENALTLYNKFETKRLIVKSSIAISTYNTEWVVEGFGNLHILQYENEKDAKNAYTQFCNMQSVEWVQPDIVIKMQEDANDVTQVSEQTYTTWGATSIGADKYSNYLLNQIGQENLPEVVVAVLDTGIDTDHPWFEGRIFEGGINFTTTNTQNIEDKNGHGTHVAGTICDLTLSNVKVLPMKVLSNNGYGYVSNFVSAINKVLTLKQTHPQIKVMNLSLSAKASVGSDTYNALKEYFDEAYSKGVAMVVASGNDGVDASGDTPANISSAITVGAVGKSRSTYYWANFSNYGSFIDVCAPGVSIVSAGVGGGTATKSGTSMACPHVAGAMALLFSDSNANYSMQSAEQVLKQSCLDLGTLGRDDYYGYGLVDLTGCYASALDDVVFSKPSGTYDNAFNLVLSINANAVIYYTLDGSVPNLQSTQYVEPIQISSSCRICARAFIVEGEIIKAISKAVTCDYVISTDQNPSDLTYKVTASVVGGGTISPSGEQTVNYGESLNFELASNYGFELGSIFVNGEVVSSLITNTFTLSNVTQNTTIVVNFVKVNSSAYVVKASCSSVGGVITPNGECAYNPGENVTYTFLADTGYYISQMIVDDQPLSESDILQAVQNGYSFNNINGNHTLFVSFELIPYTINVEVIGEGGTVTPVGENVVNYGENFALHITLEQGYKLASFKVNGEQVQLSEQTYIIENVMQNYTIVAEFEVIKFLVKLTSGQNGSLSPTGDVYVNYGENITISITPNEGYQIKSILFDGAYLPSYYFRESLTIENITADHTFAVEFERLHATFVVYQYFERVNQSQYEQSDPYKDGKYFALYSYYTSNGPIDSTTQVEAYDYAGLTPLEVEQKTILQDGSTVVNVFYKRNKYKINIMLGEGVESVNVIGEQNVNSVEYKFGEQITLQANVNTAYNFSGYFQVFDAYQYMVSTANPFSFTLPSGDVTIKAVAQIKTFTITVLDSPNGVISPNQSEWEYGSDATFTFTPNSTSYIQQVFIDGEDMGKIDSYTFTNVTKDHNLQVYFKLYTYSIVVNVGQNGSYSCVQSLEKVQAGSSRLLIVEPNEGYIVDKVIVNGNNVSALNNQVRIENVTQNTVVEITFKQDDGSGNAIGGADGLNGENVSKTQTTQKTLIYVGGGVGAIVVIGAIVLFATFKRKRRNYWNKKR